MTDNLIKSPKAIEYTRQAGRILADLHIAMGERVKPGVTGKQLDTFAEGFIRDHGAEPAFKGFLGFPATICFSVNDGMVHGLPSDYEIQEGDVVKLDAGVKLNGWNTDAARTHLVPPIDDVNQALVNVTQQAIDAGINEVGDGVPLGTVQAAIQRVIHEAGLGLVKTLSGHGIGQSVHEAPSIPNFGEVGHGVILKAGMIICIEPMVTLGNGRVELDPRDGWTYRSVDNTMTAHVEDTMVVTNNGVEVLSKR